MPAPRLRSEALAAVSTSCESHETSVNHFRFFDLFLSFLYRHPARIP
jgi:hypothetical protein